MRLLRARILYHTRIAYRPNAMCFNCATPLTNSLAAHNNNSVSLCIIRFNQCVSNTHTHINAKKMSERIHKWEIRSFYVLTVSFLFNSFWLWVYALHPNPVAVCRFFCPFSFVECLLTAFSWWVIDRLISIIHKTLSICYFCYGHLSFFSVFSVLSFHLICLFLFAICIEHFYLKVTLLIFCIISGPTLSPNWLFYLFYAHMNIYTVSYTVSRIISTHILSATVYIKTNLVWWIITNWKIKGAGTYCALKLNLSQTIVCLNALREISYVEHLLIKK